MTRLLTVLEPKVLFGNCPQDHALDFITAVFGFCESLLRKPRHFAHHITKIRPRRFTHVGGNLMHEIFIAFLEIIRYVNSQKNREILLRLLPAMKGLQQ